MLNVLGVLGASIAGLMLIPQGVSIYRMRRDKVALSGISWVSFALIFTQAAVWCTYGVIARDPWVTAPTLVNMPLSLVTAIYAFRAQRAVGKSACRFCHSGIPHEIYLHHDGSEPEMVPCTVESRSQGIAVLKQ